MSLVSDAALTRRTCQIYNSLTKFSVCLAKLPFWVALKSFPKTRICRAAQYAGANLNTMQGDEDGNRNREMV